MRDVTAELMMIFRPPVEERAAPPARAVHTGLPAVEPRPSPVYRYCLDYVQRTYGSIWVEACDKIEARDLAEYEDVAWGEPEDIDLTTIDKYEDVPVNEDELLAWDAQYAHRFTAQGEANCEACSDCLQYPEEVRTDGAHVCLACAGDGTTPGSPA